MSEARLPRAAAEFRAVHALIAVVELACLGYVWACAISGRRDRRLDAAVAVLLAEGVGLLIGRGQCPLGPLQRRLGDETPLLELVLPPRAAKLAVPILSGTATLGVAIVLVRGRRRPHKSLLTRA